MANYPWDDWSLGRITNLQCAVFKIHRWTLSRVACQIVVLDCNPEQLAGIQDLQRQRYDSASPVRSSHLFPDGGSQALARNSTKIRRGPSEGQPPSNCCVKEPRASARSIFTWNNDAVQTQGLRLTVRKIFQHFQTIDKATENRFSRYDLTQIGSDVINKEHDRGFL